MFWKILQNRCLSISLFISIFLSCDILNPSKNTFEPIEGNIHFKFKESFKTSDKKEYPQIMLLLKTEKEYPHTGFDLIVDMSIQKKTINISIDGIKNWGSGGDMFSPAFWETFLDLPNGKYILNFRDRKKIHKTNYLDSYTVIVDEKSICIKNTNQSFTSAEYNLYWRYPRNSFAYLCGTLVQDSCICDTFLDSLKKIIKIEQFTFPDEGVRPYPSFSSGYYHDSPAQYFIYIDEEDYLKAGDFLKSYSKDKLKDYEGLGISLIGWNNVDYLSWMYD